MRVNIPIEDCFRADEIVRIGRALQYDALREKHRKAILDAADLALPDYSRPTKRIERKVKGVSFRKFIRLLIP